MAQYLAPNVYVDDKANLWLWRDTESSGLGDGKWDWIGQVATGVGSAVIGYIGAKQAAKYGSGPGTSSSYLPPSPDDSIISGVSNTTLLIGGLVVMFMFMQRSKK